MDRSDPYDQFVVIPSGCEDWIRLDYLHAEIDPADMEALQDMTESFDSRKIEVQGFTRHLKTGVIPYIRFYFKEEADAAIFKLTFSHLKKPDKSRW
jgi:hypothetical protein